MVGDHAPRTRKNPLLNRSQRELLAYRDRPGEYDNDQMLDALAKCEGKDELTDEETARRNDFIALLESGRSLSWMSGFFNDRLENQKTPFAPFSAADVVAWMAEHAENVDIGMPRTEDERLDTSSALLTFFVPIISKYMEECIESGLIERVPPNRYRATETGAELFWDNDVEV